MSPRDDYAPIEDYALIGDCHSAALVRRDGSIDWACLRRFDAASVFAGILDAHRGGHWTLGPSGAARVSRRYIDGTMVLETRYVAANGGEARVLDAFTMRKGGRLAPYRQILRVIEGAKGEVEFTSEMLPRFDYGALRPWIRWMPDDGTFSAVGGDDAIVFGCDQGVRFEHLEAEGALRARFVVRAGERVRLSLSWQPPHQLDTTATPPAELDARLEQTINIWRAWLARGSYRGDYADAVARSALVLKSLTTAPTGAIIAAPTTSLPECVGGERNWDYRYSWVRDATSTLAALYVVGHGDVADEFKAFIERATAGRAEDLQIMYGCYGERRLTEIELDLEGYKRSRPVRVGNGAASQRQLDVYGELLDVAHVWRRAGNRPTEQEWRFTRSLVEAACRHWSDPDHGIWETRGEPMHFVHSKVMCWVALDRGIRAAEEVEGFDGDMARWRATRAAIRAQVESRGVDATRGCFVQSFGARELDASLLRLPLVGFVRADDPRMIATVNAVMKDLTVDGLVRRYRPSRTDDGVGGDEGVFLMCSFWLVEVLAMQGRGDEARALFERLLGLGNDMGLFAEQYDARAKTQQGNFPQAFTHVALINAANALSRAKAGVDAAASTAGDRAAATSRPQAKCPKPPRSPLRG